jgi:hypothetical protein
MSGPPLVFAVGFPMLSSAEQREISPSSELRSSIQLLLRAMEGSDGKEHRISMLSQISGIKRRRIYDILNVLESIGCCKRTDLDQLEWLGLERAESVISGLASAFLTTFSGLALESVFPCPCSVGTSDLTISFLKLFFGTGATTIDLRVASQFFSRGTPRYKTTLCKLYQITYMLSAIDVTRKTGNVCEVQLSPTYAKYLHRTPDRILLDPISLQGMLNDRQQDSLDQGFRDRLSALLRYGGHS